jgi:hypothetical protein
MAANAEIRAKHVIYSFLYDEPKKIRIGPGAFERLF